MGVTSFLDDGVLFRQRLAEPAGLHEIVEDRDHVDPAVGRRQRHLHLGDHAVGAVGVVHLVDVVAAQFQHPGFGLHGDHPGAQDVAAVAQQPPGDRAHAAGPAGHVAADRGGALGGRMKPHLLAGMGAGGGVQVVHLQPGLRSGSGPGAISLTAVISDRSSTIPPFSGIAWP